VAESTTQTDPLIAETEERAAQKGGSRAMSAANLFDLRRIIGGLFTFYGVLLIIVGLADSQKEIAKAAGVKINLYAGLGMLAVGVLFLIWAFARPLGEQLEEAEAEDGGEYPGRAAPRGTDAAALGSHQRSRGTGNHGAHPGGGPRTGRE
jgi:hypothetical protein